MIGTWILKPNNNRCWDYIVWNTNLLGLFLLQYEQKFTFHTGQGEFHPWFGSNFDYQLKFDEPISEKINVAKISFGLIKNYVRKILDLCIIIKFTSLTIHEIC